MNQIESFKAFQSFDLSNPIIWAKKLESNESLNGLSHAQNMKMGKNEPN